MSIDPARPRASSTRGRAAIGIARALIVAAALSALACREPIAPSITPRIVPSSAMRTLTGGSATPIFPIDPNPVTQVRGDARALNDAGQVTGAAINVPPTTDDVRPYRWSSATGLVQPGGLCCGTAWGADINDAGVVVGEAQIGAPSGTRAFRATGTTMVKLDTLPGSPVDGNSGAVAINASGQAVGFSTTSAPNSTHAVLWSASNVVQDLGTLGGSQSRAIDIDDAGQVIGTSTLPNDLTTHFFLWSAGTGMQDLTPLLGSTFVYDIIAINSSGQIAGNHSTNGQTHAFLYTVGSGVRDLGTLGGNFSLASGLNDSGQVVGSSQDANGITQAFLWTASTGMEDVTAITGVRSIHGLNNRLQTLAGSANFAQDSRPPSIVQLTVTGSNQPPVPSISYRCTHQAHPHQCAFDASLSTDDQRIVSYKWNWGNGRDETHASPTTRNTWAHAGRYTVTLVVKDAGGLTGSERVTVEVP